jgi:hypothetical protein
MAYNVIGQDGKTKVFSDNENLYLQKTPQEIFAEKKLAYDSSKPVSKPFKSAVFGVKTIPVLKVGSSRYRQAVKKFTPEGFSAYKKTDIDLSRVTPQGFEQGTNYNNYKLRQNEIKSDQFAEKTRIDSLIERQRQDAMLKASENEFDVKEKLNKTLNTPVQNQGVLQPIPYISSGSSPEVYSKIAYQGGKQKQTPTSNIVTQMGGNSGAMTAPPPSGSQSNPIVPPNPQVLNQLNKTNNSANTANFQMPNTSDLKFGGT